MGAALVPGRVARARAVRLSLGFLALAHAVPGGWALVAPRSFYSGFPAAGRSWVAHFPPYNEHLVRDFGALTLALAVVLALAALGRQPALVRAAALACLVFSVPHLAFHSGHLGRFGTGDVVAQLATQIAPVVLAAVVLLLGAPEHHGGAPVRPGRPPLPVRHTHRAVHGPVLRLPPPHGEAHRPAGGAHRPPGERHRAPGEADRAPGEADRPHPPDSV